MKKYELTDDVKVISGITLRRIKALKDFGDIKVDDLGGYVESENNLSQDGDAWVCGDAKVCGNAWVYGDAKVYGDAWVCGNAKVSGNAKVYGDAKVCGNAWVYGNAEVCGNAKVSGNARVFGDAWVCGNAKVSGNARVSGDADYIVFKNWWSSGRYFTWTRSNDKWCVGCFYGSGDELIAKAYQDSQKSGDNYKKIVEYVNSIK